MKKVAVILSGCGVFDGSEIHESVLTLLALDRLGAQSHCIAPNIAQTRVVNHLTKRPVQEERNVLVESARIARGQIKDISTALADDYDAAIYPGGFGAAHTLSDFGTKGASCRVNPEVLTFAKAMAEAGKPQGFICIAPALISPIYGPDVTLTIGTDSETANTLAAMGGDHAECDADDIVIDQKHKVVSTPAYMLAQSIKEVAVGIDKLVKEILELA